MTLSEGARSAQHISAVVPAQWEIEWRVRQVTAVQFDIAFHSLTPGCRLVEDLGIDSLDIAELIMGLEEEFDVTIPDDAPAEVFTRSPVTLGDLAVLVRRCWGTSTPARSVWRAVRAEPTSAEVVPFTQLGPASSGEDRCGPLYRALGTNREGYSEYRRRTDGMRCIMIPAGLAQLGTDGPDAPANQTPSHIVTISEFLLDAEPVSHAAYARFLNSVSDAPAHILAEWCGVAADDRRQSQYALHRGRNGWIPTPGTERQPMILVSWWGANAYSLWVHGLDWRLYRTRLADGDPSHLPSEAQWEYAARGGEMQPVPPDRSLVEAARVARHTTGARYDADTLPAANVSERIGMSPFGVHHMRGNVWQWCRDWYDPDFYRQPDALQLDPQNSVSTGIRSERGGSWVGPSELAAPWYRRGRPPEARGRCLGFRCVGRHPD